MTAGYSDRSLMQKLGLKSGMRVVFEEPPDNYDRLLGPLPEDVEIDNELDDGGFDFIQSFMRRGDEYIEHLPMLARALRPTGILWVSWPKHSSRLREDLDEALVRSEALKLGLVDVKVCAIDADWSGLKFMWRREHRTSL